MAYIARYQFDESTSPAFGVADASAHIRCGEFAWINERIVDNRLRLYNWFPIDAADSGAFLLSFDVTFLVAREIANATKLLAARVTLEMFLFMCL